MQFALYHIAAETARKTFVPSVIIHVLENELCNPTCVSKTTFLTKPSLYVPLWHFSGEQLSLGFEFLIKFLSSPQPHGSQREKFYLIFVYLNLGE